MLIGKLMLIEKGRFLKKLSHPSWKDLKKSKEMIEMIEMKKTKTSRMKTNQRSLILM